MKISELFKSRVQNNATHGAGKGAQANSEFSLENNPAAAANAVANGEDVITISPLARRYAQHSQLLSEDEQARNDRVAELKAQVAEGRYSVNSDEVAKSIVDYLKS